LGQEQPIEPFSPLPIDDVKVVSPAEPKPSPIDECFPWELPAAPEDMHRRIQRILEANHLASDKAAVLAVAYPEGVVLFQHNPHAMMNPASVTKLFTAAAALEVLGPERKFETKLVAGEGDCPPLYLVGGGDPGLTEENLDKLAAAARKGGVACAQGLFYDVSVFDGQTLPPQFEEKESDAHWRPRVGACGMCEGAISVRITPGEYDGAAPSVKVVPDCGGIMVDSRALTRNAPAKDKPVEVSIAEHAGKTVVQVSGEIGVEKNDGELFRRAVPDPDLMAAWYLLDRLTDKGVKVKASRPEKGTAPADCKTIASIESEPVRDDVKRMQTWSKNFVAEQLVKLLGSGECSPLTFACGLDRLREALPRFGVSASCLRLKNGSGLFDANRVSVEQVVRLLVEAANRGPWGRSFIESLPLSRKEGTMKDRLHRLKAKVRGKTGTLDGISTLAGYIERKHGRYTAFAIFFSDPDKSALSLRKVQDAVVEILAAWRAP